MKIFSNRKKTILYATGVIVVLITCFAFFKLKNSKEDKISFEPPKVTVSAAVFGPVSKYVNAIGTLRAFDSVIIKSEVNARIEKICFSEGAVVKESDLLIELDDSMAKAQLAEAEAQYRKAKCEFGPIEKLTDKGVMARIQRDSKKAEMDMAEARVNSHKNNWEKHKVLAPFGGKVGLIEISKGQFVAPGNDLIKIVDCYPLKADFKVAEADIEKIYIGQEIQVSVGGDNTKTFIAKIVAIDPESDKITHSFDVRAILDVPEEVAATSQVLKPGRFVSVKIAIDGDQQGIVIPESTLEKVGDEDVVFRVMEGLAIRTLVTVGTRRDGNVEIITGLNEGDLVITSGQIGVLDGKEVDIKNDNSTSDVAKAVKEMYEQQKMARKKLSDRK